MTGLNITMAIGNEGTDPEMKYTPNGNAVTTFRLAVTRRYNDSDGQRKKSQWAPEPKSLKIQGFAMVVNSVPKGRGPSIPPAYFEMAQGLHKQGRGYGFIADHLMSLGVDTSRSSVERLIKGRGA